MLMFFLCNLDWKDLAPFFGFSMAPYIVLSHVQHEINTKAPVVKKPAKNSRMLCSVGVVVPWTGKWPSLYMQLALYNTACKRSLRWGLPLGASSMEKWIKHETHNSGGFFKTLCEWGSERWSKWFLFYIEESCLLNGNLNTVIMKHILNEFWQELAMPSAIEVGL